MFSFQYTFFNHSNLFLSLLALLHFIRPMVSLTEYFGGMIIIVWIWSTWIFCSMISTIGMSFSIFGHICVRYSFTPGFRIRLRYFGIHTTWYSVRYTECPDSLFSMIHKFIPKYLRACIHPRACPWNSAARLENISRQHSYFFFLRRWLSIVKKTVGCFVTITSSYIEVSNVAYICRNRWRNWIGTHENNY